MSEIIELFPTLTSLALYTKLLLLEKTLLLLLRKAIILICRIFLLVKRNNNII